MNENKQIHKTKSNITTNLRFYEIAIEMMQLFLLTTENLCTEFISVDFIHTKILHFIITYTDNCNGSNLLFFVFVVSIKSEGSTNF